MFYEIEKKNDFSTGTSLIVKIPVDDLDQNALYTVQEDMPPFILPFRYRSVDGHYEFVYQIGTLSKLQKLSGCYSAKEYALLWQGMLSPLLECGDWFMKPYSFLLNAENLYCDLESKNVSFLYIPSLRECSGYGALKEMASDFANIISVDDANLENKVLRIIMKDLNIKDFMQILKPYITQCAAPPETRQITSPDALTAQEMPECGMIEPVAVYNGNLQIQENALNAPTDIIINIPDNNHQEKRNKDGHRGKESKKYKSHAGIFNKIKEAVGQEVVLG